MKSDFFCTKGLYKRGCTKEQKRQVFSLEGNGSADYANNGSLEIRFVSIGCLAVSDDIRGERSRLQMP